MPRRLSCNTNMGALAFMLHDELDRVCGRSNSFRAVSEILKVPLGRPGRSPVSAPSRCQSDRFVPPGSSLRAER